MYYVYVPFENVEEYSYYYYSNDMNLIYCTNDNENFIIIDISNHYNLINSNNININDLILIDNNHIVNNWTYRNDLSDILICLFFFCCFFIGIPLLLLSKFFKKRW